MPVPLSGALCGPPGASSETVSVPTRGPVVVGAKVVLIEQDALTASVAGAIGHVLVRAKSLPVTAMAVMASGAVPVLVNVVVRAALVVPTSWEPNAWLAGLRLAAGAVPVPDSATACGEPAASSATWRLAARAPLADGVKVTVIVQVAFAARALGP